MAPTEGEAAPAGAGGASAVSLLEAQGLRGPGPLEPRPTGCDVLAWARSGAMALTGRPEGPPRWPAGPVGHRVEDLARTVARYGEPAEDDPGLDPGILLGGRAAERGLHRQGARSAGGRCRLIETDAGWLAVSLARPFDLEVLGAVLGRPVEGDPWAALERAGARRPGSELVERARLVGMAAALCPGSGAGPEGSGRPPFVAERLGEPGRAEGRRSLVVDLSAMWAGPLCAHLLGRLGARVVKVEDPARPDSARVGDPRLFDRLQAGHEGVALDLSSEEGRGALRALVEAADVVVESSRPRALRQLGLEAEVWVGAREGRTWVSITGYGRGGEAGNWVAFGDDAAVAGGLVAREDGGPLFCADAVADPLAGLVAGLAALASQAGGGGHLLDVAMSACAAFALSGAPCPGEHRVTGGPAGRWRVACGGESVEVAPPRSVRPAGRGPALGVDTARVLAELCPGVSA